MILRLLISALFSFLGLYGLNEVQPAASLSVNQALMVLTVLLMGYHRCVIPKQGKESRMLPTLPNEEKMKVVDRMWGINLSDPRPIRIAPKARKLSEESPRLSMVIEAFPMFLRNPLRKLIAKGSR